MNDTEIALICLIVFTVVICVHGFWLDRRDRKRLTEGELVDAGVQIVLDMKRGQR